MWLKELQLIGAMLAGGNVGHCSECQRLLAQSMWPSPLHSTPNCAFELYLQCPSCMTQHGLELRKGCYELSQIRLSTVHPWFAGFLSPGAGAPLAKTAPGLMLPAGRVGWDLPERVRTDEPCIALSGKSRFCRCAKCTN